MLLSIFICLYFCITRRCYVFIAFTLAIYYILARLPPVIFLISCHYVILLAFLLAVIYFICLELLATILFFSPFPLADILSFAAILYLLSFHPPFIIFLASLLALTLVSASPPVIPFTVDLISTAVPFNLAYRSVSEPC